jgi:predicted alpha/beta-hydrolase family hydrolase
VDNRATVLAHIAGIPVEETALSLAPVALTVAGVAGARLRSGWRRKRNR